MILAIETATTRLSVAFVDGDDVLFSASIATRNAHDALLVPLIDRMLRQIDGGFTGVRAVAVSAGPGSFTGLRIGMAAAKGYAFTLGIPLIAVPTFDAMAFLANDRLGGEDNPMFAPVFDARREDVYLGGYSLGSARPVPLFPATAVGAREAAARLQEGTMLYGDGAIKLTAIAEKRFRVIPARYQLCHAEGVGFVGVEMLSRGETTDVAACEPIYVREFQTTSPKTRQ